MRKFFNLATCRVEHFPLNLAHIQQLETRKNRVISGEVGWLDDVEVAGRTKGASFGLISMMSGVDSAGFADLQTESAYGF